MKKYKNRITGEEEEIKEHREREKAIERIQSTERERERERRTHQGLKAMIEGYNRG